MSSKEFCSFRFVLTLLGAIVPLHLDDRNIELCPRAFITPFKSIHIQTNLRANPNNTTRAVRLLDGDRLGKVTGHVDVDALGNRHPVGHELQRDNVD